MTRPVPLLAALIAVAVPAVAHAAGDFSGVPAALDAACKAPPTGVRPPAGMNGVVAAKDLRAIVLDALAPKPDLLLDQGAEGLARLVTLADVDHPTASAKAPAGSEELRLDVLAWLGMGDEPVKLRLARRSGELATEQDLPWVMKAIFTADGDAMTAFCSSPTAIPPPPPEPGGPEKPPAKPFWDPLLIAKTKDALSGTDITKKSFAELSAQDDRRAKTQSYGVVMAVGWRLQPLLQESWYKNPDAQHPNQPWSLSLLPYATYSRKGSSDPKAAGVNNLNFGLSADGSYTARGDHTYIWRYAVSYEHQTDDDFKSSADAFELRVSPGLGLIPGRYIAYNLLPEDSPTHLDFRWSVEGVADWFSVSDAGDKKSLVDAAEYGRLGYDAGVTFRIGPSDADWRIIWATTYDVRNGQTHHGGDASMLSSSIKIALGQASNYAFGVSYDQGKDLQSFEPTRIWKLTFGVRR